MLASHLGTETFLLGVSNYLKANAYGNATTNDLWQALSKASGQDISAMMDPFIRKIGFPVVTVAEEPGQIGISQSRFLSTGDVKPEEDSTIWWIPLGLRTASQSTADTPHFLAKKQDTIRSIDESFYKINTDYAGFFRTNYPPARLVQLGAQKDKLSVQDKIGLIADAGALAISGQGTTPSLLAFIEPFQDETNKLVWSEIISSLGTVRSVFSENESLSSALRAFTLKLVSPAAEKLGWEFAAGEGFLTSQLRALLISTAGLAGHKAIIAEAQRRFKLYISGEDKKAIHPNLRSAVYKIVIAHGGKAEYEAIKQEALTATSVDGREIALQAMGSVKSAELAKDLFTFTMSDRVAIQDKHTPATALSANGKTRETLWHCIKEDWEPLYKQLSGNMVVIDRFLRVSLNNFASREIGNDIESFFADKDVKGYDRSLAVVKDTIAGNASYRERDEGVTTEWLAASGYA